MQVELLKNPPLSGLTLISNTSLFLMSYARYFPSIDVYLVPNAVPFKLPGA